MRLHITLRQLDDSLAGVTALWKQSPLTDPSCHKKKPAFYYLYISWLSVVPQLLPRGFNLNQAITKLEEKKRWKKEADLGRETTIKNRKATAPFPPSLPTQSHSHYHLFLLKTFSYSSPFICLFIQLKNPPRVLVCSNSPNAASLHTKLTGLEQPKATPPPAWIRGSLILSCLTSSQDRICRKITESQHDTFLHNNTSRLNHF